MTRWEALRLMCRDCKRVADQAYPEVTGQAELTNATLTFAHTVSMNLREVLSALELAGYKEEAADIQARYDEWRQATQRFLTAARR